MLPHEFPPFPQIRELDLYATMTPAREVGGTFTTFSSSMKTIWQS
jgi:sigma-B regulation protein RsbU (phosphoserine phosphatase)